MVRQAYLTRLALGRSAYEVPERPQREELEDGEALLVNTLGNDGPDEQAVVRSEEYLQQYDIRGHPENPSSRSAARRSRWAQNDILATIGVCVSVNTNGMCVSIDTNGKLVPTSAINSSKESAESQKVDKIVMENEFGFWLGCIDVGALELSTHFLASLRQRFQTFSSYAGLSLLQINSIRGRNSGVFKLFWAGLPAVFIFEVLDLGRELVIDELRDNLMHRFVSPLQPEDRNRRIMMAISCLEQGLTILTFIAIAPVKIIATLQQLNLLPAWPLLLNPLNLSLATLSQFLLPPVPVQWNMRSVVGFAVSSCLSPISLLYCSRMLSCNLNPPMKKYIRLLLPIPDRPDEYSKKAATRAVLSEENFSSLTFDSGKRENILDEVKKDFHGLINKLGTCRNFLNMKNVKSVAWKVFERKPDLPKAPPSHAHPTEESEAAQISSLSFHSVADPNGSTTPILEPLITTSMLTSPFADSPLVMVPSPQLSVSSEDDFLLNGLEVNNTVQITTRTGSSDTLHMNVEVNGTVPGVPIATSSFSASPRQGLAETVAVQEVISVRQHKVSALTTHPANALTDHISYSLVTVLGLPLETAFLRAVAYGFIAASSLHASSLQRPGRPLSVHPRGAWFGLGLTGGGWRGAGDYAGAIGLCLALETAVGLLVWQASCGIAWWAGKRWFLWGRL